MPGPSLNLIAYDSSSDRRRERIASELEAVGWRVQRSVFEAWLSQRDLDWLQRRLVMRLDEDDHLRIYQVCDTCRSQVRVYGGAQPVPPPPAFVL